jgi:hypothetical protein
MGPFLATSAPTGGSCFVTSPFCTFGSSDGASCGGWMFVKPCDRKKLMASSCNCPTTLGIFTVFAPELT